MQAEYRMLVREQLICGTQVHVDVDGRDLAVAVAHRVAPWLPALLALSASSPFWLGTDTGYASYRTLIWRRWPTAGTLPGFASAADYDRAVADLVRSGIIADPGMIYFDVRPSAHLPTLELRIADSCPRLDDVVLLAGLFRALVTRETAAAARRARPRRPPPRRRHTGRRNPRHPAMAAGHRACPRDRQRDPVNLPAADARPRTQKTRRA